MKRRQNNNDFDPHEDETAVDRVVRQSLGDNAVPEDVEERLRGQLSEFRRRLAEREIQERRRPWWIVFRSPGSAGIAFAGVSAAAVMVLVLLSQAPGPKEFLETTATTTPRTFPGPAAGTSPSHADLGPREGHPMNLPPEDVTPADQSPSSVAFLYDPTNGTVSAGDIWRVSQGELSTALGSPGNNYSGLHYSVTSASARTSSQLRRPAKANPSLSPMPGRKGLGPTVLSVPDVYIKDADVDLAVTHMFRYSDALVLWDYVTPGVAGTSASSSNTLYWTWAAKNYDYTVQPPDTTPEFSTESYDRVTENTFTAAAQEPLSTFSIDVDTASYANVRRMLMNKQLPPPDAVRIEEFINYFPYEYPQPSGDAPFSATTDVAVCPWAPNHLLVRIGLKGREIEAAARPPCNLVFLLDVSGSMDEPNKLPLLKDAFKRLVDQLEPRDTVAIVVYAGASGLVLPATPASDRIAILDAIDRLQAGGITNGGAGIQLAYDTATQSFIRGGANRVILATDGDFNVGITDRGSLTRLIEDKAKTGVFLSILGFGMGNLKDATLEELSRKGNGNYAYIDNSLEARKVFVEQINGTLVTIAKDVKIQVEFNPAAVESYRLVGYENRLMAAEDFNDDRKDAGEIGAGHTVTALYEIIPVGAGNSQAPTAPPASHPSAPSYLSDSPDPSDLSDLSDSADPKSPSPAAPPVDPLKYQKPRELTDAARAGELLTLKLRYKAPDGDTSRLLEFPVANAPAAIDHTTPDFQFAAAVAGFGMILRSSEYKGSCTYEMVRDLGRRGLGTDSYGYRAEFLDLVDLAESLSPAPKDR